MTELITSEKKLGICVKCKVLHDETKCPNCGIAERDESSDFLYRDQIPGDLVAEEDDNYMSGDYDNDFY